MHTAIRWILILLCLSLASIAQAQTSLLVALHIQATRIDLAYPADVVRKTEFSSLSLYWEEPLASWLEGHIEIGALDVTQSSNPIAEGQSTSGHTLALGLRFHLYRSNALQLHTDLNYQYADTRANPSGQGVELSWHQVSAQVGADIHLFQYSYLTLVAGALAIDGKEQATGAVNSTLEFNEQQQTFGKVGILIGLDHESHIGLEVSSGAISGGHIYFQRWF